MRRKAAATRGQDDRKERAPVPEPFVLTKADVTCGDCGQVGDADELDSRKLSFHEKDARSAPPRPTAHRP